MKAARFVEGFEGPWSREVAEDQIWFATYAKKYLPNCTCKVLTRRDGPGGTDFFCRGEEAGRLRRNDGHVG